jgi:hypothetical protein
MDSSDRSVPADQLARIEVILERARRLSAPEIATLVRAFRGDGRAGEQGQPERERRRRRTRAISISVARSGLTRRADQVQGSAAAAVRTAAEQRGRTERLGPLGLLFDAERAVADAALAVLLEDHISKEVAGLLRQPFEVAIGGSDAGTRKDAGR